MKKYNNKNDRVLLILCLLGGYFGLHYFYCGKVKMGLIYLFTFGLFGFGWIIDSVEIIKYNVNTSKIDKEIVIDNYEINTKRKPIIEPIKKISFDVAGVTSNEYNRNIKLIIKNGFKNDFLEKYMGYNEKEIIEEDGKGEIEFQNLYNLYLKIIDYNNEKTIKIYADSFNLDDRQLAIGFVPQKKLKELLPYLDKEKYEVKINGYFTGGKYKRIDPMSDDVDNPNLEIIEYKVGIHIIIQIYTK